MFATTDSGLLDRPTAKGDKGAAASSRSRTATTAGMFILFYLIVKGFKPSSEQSHARFPMEGHR